MRADGGGDGRLPNLVAYCRSHEFIALPSTGWAAKQRAEQPALPIRILTGDGAQVALQRCPILRAGKPNCITAVN